jgi:hypothetical protein
MVVTEMESERKRGTGGWRSGLEPGVKALRNQGLGLTVVLLCAKKWPINSTEQSRGEDKRQKVPMRYIRSRAD